MSMLVQTVPYGAGAFSCRQPPSGAWVVTRKTQPRHTLRNTPALSFASFHRAAARWLPKLSRKGVSASGNSKVTDVGLRSALPVHAHVREVQHAGLSREACCVILEFVSKLL